MSGGLTVDVGASLLKFRLLRLTAYQIDSANASAFALLSYAELRKDPTNHVVRSDAPGKFANQIEGTPQT